MFASSHALGTLPFRPFRTGRGLSVNGEGFVLSPRPPHGSLELVSLMLGLWPSYV